MSIALSLHLLAAVLWVGGMFFAYTSLRPVAAELLEPPQRLSLWTGVFKRFFFWVWAFVIILPATGYWMIFKHFGGFGQVGLHVHIMNGLGLIMILLFAFLFFSPYKKMRAAVEAGNIPEGAKNLALIRKIILINLTLGIFTIIIVGVGRYI